MSQKIKKSNKKRNIDRIRHTRWELRMGGVNTGGQALRTAFAVGNLVGPGFPSKGKPLSAQAVSWTSLRS